MDASGDRERARVRARVSRERTTRGRFVDSAKVARSSLASSRRTRRSRFSRAASSHCARNRAVTMSACFLAWFAMSTRRRASESSPRNCGPERRGKWRQARFKYTAVFQKTRRVEWTARTDLRVVARELLVREDEAPHDGRRRGVGARARGRLARRRRHRARARPRRWRERGTRPHGVHEQTATRTTCTRNAAYARMRSAGVFTRRRWRRVQETAGPMRMLPGAWRREAARGRRPRGLKRGTAEPRSVARKSRARRAI